jgi:fucose permease
MILLACAGVPGCGFFTWLMGVVGNHLGGLQSAFYLVPGCFLVLTLLIATDGALPKNEPRRYGDTENG